jgi:hypothetical protein
MRYALAFARDEKMPNKQDFKKINLVPMIPTAVQDEHHPRGGGDILQLLKMCQVKKILQCDDRNLIP